MASGSSSLVERVRHFLFEPAAAELALEFSSVAITGARIEAVGGRPELRALVSEPLSEGAFSPRLDDPGFVSKEEIRDVVKRVLSRLGALPQARAALIVPDVVVRFRLFAQDEVKAEPGKRDALVAFRMTKLLPFAPGDLRVVSSWPRSSGAPVLALGFSSAVLGAYEEVGRAFGLDVGSVETSSMALLRGLSVTGDALLVRHDPRWLTLTLIRDGLPVSVRVFDVEIAGRPDEVRKELVSTAVFWKDRLGGQNLSAAFVHATDPWFQMLCGEVSSLFGRDPERVRTPSHLLVKGIPAAIERSAAPALALLGAGH